MLWIKICGLTTPEGVQAAVGADADAIGFVFAPSKRRVTPAQARELAHNAAPHVMRVAVMQHPTQQLVDEVCEVFRPDALQTDAEDLIELRLPSQMHSIPVYRDRRSAAAPLPARLLYEGAVSGAGIAADWSAARTLAEATQLILAGGLNSSNVAEAISRVHPFGVDVSSGVESEAGIKDPIKIEQFIRAARAVNQFRADRYDGIYRPNET